MHLRLYFSVCPYILWMVNNNLDHICQRSIRFKVNQLAIFYQKKRKKKNQLVIITKCIYLIIKMCNIHEFQILWIGNNNPLTSPLLFKAAPSLTLVKAKLFIGQKLQWQGMLTHRKGPSEDWICVQGETTLLEEPVFEFVED